MRLQLFALIVSTFVPVTALVAQTTRPSRPAAATAPASEYSLTIYSTADPATFDPQQLAQQRLANPYNQWQLKLPGYGVVRETRAIELKEGENLVRFSDVAAGIDPTTVAFKSLTAPDAAAVLEQNYEYDVVSAGKLLEKYLGKEISVSRKASPDVTRPVDDVVGTLLSSDPANLVLQTADKGDVMVLSRSEITAVRLAKQETGLITKPTLVWKVQSDQAGKHDAQVTYQTDGLTWRADYNVIVNKDDTAADISAWVSILNESGASYPEAKLKLVAGDVQRIQPPEQIFTGTRAMRLEGAARADTGFQQKAFFEYHLYTLGRPTSLANNSTKQIELFDARNNVPVTKTYVYYGLPEQIRYWITPEPNQDRNLGTQSNKKVDIYLQLKNSEANGMGIPLPAGRLRVYKQDEADAANEFVGEDVIQHTPKDEEVLVKLGTAFDVVGERKQTDFNAQYERRNITESFEIKVRNHKEEPVKVIIRENLFRWTNWEITKRSDEFEKQDFRTIHFPVEVPAGGEKTVTYTVRYTW